MSRHPGARFSNPAELYDLIYGFKDYAGEATRLRDVLNQAGIADGSRVSKAPAAPAPTWHRCRSTSRRWAYDLDPGMVAVAQRNAHRSTVWVGDLRTAAPDEPVDAALVLFGGLAYVFPEPQFQAACHTLFASVRPGGVALVEPWLTPDDHQDHTVQMAIVDLPYLKVARQCVPQRTDDLLDPGVHYLGRPARHGGGAHHRAQRALPVPTRHLDPVPRGRWGLTSR